MPNKAGRKKGIPNKQTFEFNQVLVKHNFCAASAMLEIYKESRDSYFECKDNANLITEAPRYLKIAGDMAKEIANYIYPKRKAVDVTVSQVVLDQIKVFENKSTEELLDILNTSVQGRVPVLEIESKKIESV